MESADFLTFRMYVLHVCICILYVFVFVSRAKQLGDAGSSGVSGLHTSLGQLRITVSQPISDTMQFTQSDMCAVLQAKYNQAVKNTIYIYSRRRGRHTDILPRGGGGGGLLPIALLLRWPGLPEVSVNVLLQKSPNPTMPTGRSHCLTVIQRQQGTTRSQ